MPNQVAIQFQRDAGRQGHRVLESGVAAGIAACVEVGVAEYGLLVICRILQKVGDAKIHAASPCKYFAAKAMVERIGIGVLLGVCLGKADAHLHGAAGTHRVAV